ncbi:phosphatase [Virgibacillus sp. W0181]|uniref:phosphatase n=1 Tax=Virgibacillus sp. W0181 TaxID=3391581 RepID=UPI003F4555D2
MLSSAIIYGSVLISASIYSQALAQTSWEGEHGIFGTAIREVGTVPIIITVLLALAGVIFIVISMREK